MVKEIKFKEEEISRVEAQVKAIVDKMGYKLHTMNGIDIVTAAKLIGEIGDIERFPTPAKLANMLVLLLLPTVQVKRINSLKVNRATGIYMVYFIFSQFIKYYRIETPRIHAIQYSGNITKRKCQKVKHQVKP